MTSDVSTLAVKPRDFEITRFHLIIAGVVLLIIGVAVFLYRQRAVEVQLATSVYEDIETTVSAKGNVVTTTGFRARATPRACRSTLAISVLRRLPIA